MSASIITVDLGEDVAKVQESFVKYSSLVVTDVAGDIAKSVTKRTAEIAKAEMEMVITQIEDTVQQIAEKGASELYSALGINEETITFAKNVIKIASNATSFAGAAVMKGLLVLNSFDTYSIPLSVATCALQMVANFADMILKSFIEAYGIYIDLIVEFIVDPGAALEIVKEVIDIALQQIYEMIDEQVYKYLGMSIAQIRYYIRKGWDLYKQYRAARKKKKEEKEKSEAEQQEGINVSKSKTNIDVDIDVSINPDFFKEQMNLWLAKQRDAIFNGFLIMQILDAVNSIKEMVKCLTDVNLETLGDNIDSLDDLIAMLDDLGLGDDSTAIDLSLIPALNINDIYAGLNSLTDTDKMVNELSNLGGAVARSVDFDGSVSTSKQKMYDIKTDAENKTITMDFYVNPTKNSVSKKVYKLLTDAKSADGNPLFTMSECKVIQENIFKLYKDNQQSGSGTATVKTSKYTIVINLNIETKQNNPKEDDIEAAEGYKEPDTKTINLSVVNEEMKSKKQIDKERTETRRNTIALLHTVFSVLKNIVPQLSIIATLIQNYKTNKAYALSRSKDNLFQLFKEAMRKLGLDKSVKLGVNPDGTTMTAMYTVRTLELYNYVKNSLKILNTGGESAVQIYRNEAKRINTWLRNNDPGALSCPEEDKVLLFIDYNSINLEQECVRRIEQRYGNNIDENLKKKLIKDCTNKKNGTTDGMENIEIVDDEIIYTDSSLPRMGSQIMMAMYRGYKYDE